MALRRQEPGPFAAARKAAGRRRGAASIETGGNRRPDHRLHRGVVGCADRQRRRRSGKQSARASRPRRRPSGSAWSARPSAGAWRQRSEREPTLEHEAARRSLEAAAATRLARRTRMLRLSRWSWQSGLEPARLLDSEVSRRRSARPSALRRAASASRRDAGASRRDTSASKRKDQALRNQSLSLAFLSQQTAAAGDTEAAILLALEALPKDMTAPDRPYLLEAEAPSTKALLRAPSNQDLPP